MMNAGYWMTEYFSISSVLKKSPGKYMRAYLYTESDNRDLGYFVAQQLEAIEQSIQGLHAYIARKHAEDQAARRMLRTARQRHAAQSPSARIAGQRAERS